MAGHVMPVNDCRRQGVGLYWSWRRQRDSTSNVRGIPEKPRRDVTRTAADDVIRRLRGFAGDASEPDRLTRDRNPPAAERRSRRLDPLLHDPDRHYQQQQQRLPRQRRRHRQQQQMTSRTSLAVPDATPRDHLCASCGTPMTSRTAIGDVTTSPRDVTVVSRSPYGAATSPLTLLTPTRRRRKPREPGSWGESSGAGWDMSGLMDTPGRTSYIQLQLVEEQHNLSLVQVRLQLIVIVLLCSSAVLDSRVGHISMI